MPSPSDRRFEQLFTLAFACTFFGAMVAEVARDYHPLKLGAVFVLAWRLPLLAIHEAGHALAGRLVGAEVRRLVVGYGRVLRRGVVAGISVELRAFPIEGFVSLVHRADSSRLACAFTYAAGVGAEAAVVLPLITWLGWDQLFVASADPMHLLVQAAAIELGLSALSNLVPRLSFRDDPNAEPMPNDGLGVLRSLLGR